MIAGCDWRISVVGTTGSGKTTLACQIAGRLKIPHIELDALHWGPDWTQAPLQLFRARVTDAVKGGAWVVDGNYGKVRDIVWALKTYRRHREEYSILFEESTYAHLDVVHLPSPRSARAWVAGLPRMEMGRSPCPANRELGGNQRV